MGAWFSNRYKGKEIIKKSVPFFSYMLFLTKLLKDKSVNACGLVLLSYCCCTMHHKEWSKFFIRQWSILFLLSSYCLSATIVFLISLVFEIDPFPS